MKLNGGGASMAATSLPGKDGFEILEYIGSSAGDMTWWGPESRTRYVFGGTRRIGYVDKRDVAKMVALVDQGQSVFRVYQKPKELEIKVTLETQDFSKGAKAYQEGIEALAQVEPEIPPFDPSGLSVAKLKSRLDGLEPAQLQALLEAERVNLNRKGAIAAIEGAIYGVVNA